LAVTEVNGCAACSYQHIMMALRQGMSKNMAKKAATFLSAVQIMIAGNMYGIPYSAFQSRQKAV